MSTRLFATGNVIVKSGVVSLLPLLLVILLVSCNPKEYAYITDHGAVTITKYNGAGGAVTIPGMLEGLPVRLIGDRAFQECTNVLTVTIPSGVTNIGECAFQRCSSLTDVRMPSTVLSLGAIAFSGCSSLTCITIPRSVISIGPRMFDGCTSLVSIMVDPLNSFYSGVGGVLLNRNLTVLLRCPEGKTGSVTIPKTVTSMGVGAWDDCVGVRVITVDPLNPIYSSMDGMLFNKIRRVLIRCPGGKEGNVAIPTSVVSIGNSAFQGCAELPSVAIPSATTNIDAYAFAYCSGLTNVTLPEGVVSIGGEAFSYCTSLGMVTIPASVTRIGDCAFYACHGMTGVYFEGDAPKPRYWRRVP